MAFCSHAHRAGQPWHIPHLQYCGTWYGQGFPAIWIVGLVLCSNMSWQTFIHKTGPALHAQHDTHSGNAWNHAGFKRHQRATTAVAKKSYDKPLRFLKEDMWVAFIGPLGNKNNLQWAPAGMLVSAENRTAK